MTILSNLSLLCFGLIVAQSSAFSNQQRIQVRSSTHSRQASSTAMCAALTLYGSQGSRSPLVNWAADELGIEISMGDLAKNPHPFGQIPCLVDNSQDEEVMVFESGAILLYINSLVAASDDSKMKHHQRHGEINSWVCWANASLDPICFLETPEGKVYDTGLKNKGNKKIRTLNTILTDRKFLVDDGASLTIADVAVSSYLLYVVQFFPDIDLSPWPEIVRYMKDCASREAYGKAFGKPTQSFLLEKLDAMGGSKKLFGMF